MPFKNILACIDFTEISDAVVNSAALIAKIFDAKLNLITIVERPVPFVHEGSNELIEPEEIEILLKLEQELKKEASEKLSIYSEKLISEGLHLKTIIVMLEILYL